MTLKLGWRLFLAVALSLIAFSAQGAPAASLSTARAFVAKLYASYQGAGPDYVGRDAATTFAPRLLRLIRQDQAEAKGEVGILDGDPICDCQDAGGLRVRKLAVQAVSANQARASVLLDLDGETRALTLDLQAANSRWRVADVHSRDTPSLVRLLDQGLRAKGPLRDHRYRGEGVQRR